MDKPFYEFTILDDAQRFDFVSIGKKEIPKAIIFQKTSSPSLFALIMGNVTPDDVIDTETISNNGDMEMILATVFRAIAQFLEANPNAIVGFSGSSESRTRLYQIAISRELISLRESFCLYGLTADDIKPFRPDQRYLGFFLSLKNVNIV